MKLLRNFVFSGVVLLGLQSSAQRLLPAAEWLIQESLIAQLKIQQSISAPGTVPGTVIASPQKEEPNYFRHWVRDGGLTMKVVAELAKNAPNRKSRLKWDLALQQFTVFSRQNQLTESLMGLGEPIFEITGQVFAGPWGRPQNDGPAVRASALTIWALDLLDQGKEEYVKTWLYNSVLPASTVIKADLEYISHHWRDSSFDLWEEVKGDHFFTRMVQRKALMDGAVLAERMNDPAAAQWYRSQAQALSEVLAQHWKSRQNVILPTLNRVEGADYKISNLDIAVILGVLHGHDDNFLPTDVRVISTFEQIVKRFSEIYFVNHLYAQLAPALGRYPEDIYAGSDFSGGNPWVLATLAGAEYSYEMAALAQDSSTAKHWLARGDQFVQRVQFHANSDGSLSEQIQRRSGYMVSAANLTWNYSAVMTTLWARNKAEKKKRFLGF